MHPMIVHDAKEMAGCFYENERSDTFRATWPRQMEYVETKWHHFVAGVREVYAELLAHPNVDEEQKERMYEALIADSDKTMSDGASSPMQIAKDSEVFTGSRRENRVIVNSVGSGPQSLRARLRTTSALLN